MTVLAIGTGRTLRPLRTHRATLTLCTGYTRGTGRATATISPISAIPTWHAIPAISPVHTGNTILAVSTGQPVRTFHTIQTRGTLRTNRANQPRRTINTIPAVNPSGPLRAAHTGRTRHTLHTPLNTLSIHTQARPVKTHRLLPARGTHLPHTAGQPFSGCTIRLGFSLLRIPLGSHSTET